MHARERLTAAAAAAVQALMSGYLLGVALERRDEHTELFTHRAVLVVCDTLHKGHLTHAPPWPS